MAFDTSPVPNLPQWILAEDEPADHGWPLHGLVDDLLPTLEAWVQDTPRIALATLVTVEGSAPRPVGSQMLVRADGRMAGYVSGGCVEGAIAAEAVDMLSRGAPSRFLTYGPGSPAMDVRLTCGGTIGVLVSALAAGRLALDWRRARQDRRVLWQSIDLVAGELSWQSDDPPPPGCFCRPLPPPLRLWLVGGDPVTLALAALAPDFGLEACILRPQGPVAPPPGIALARYDNRALETALAGAPLDAFSAVYTLTHDTDTDHRVLTWALASPAFCVGALGSRRRMDSERQRLRGEGLPESYLHAPAGIDLGRADSPCQIALSILAEVTALRPRPDSGVDAGASRGQPSRPTVRDASGARAA